MLGVQKQFSAVIEKEGKWYTALCPELGVASQGKTRSEALKNLKEAVELYLEDEDVQKQLKGRQFAIPMVTTFTV